MILRCETKSDNSFVLIDVDASGPFDSFNFTCFSIIIFFALFCFFSIEKIIGAVIPNV